MSSQVMVEGDVCYRVFSGCKLFLLMIEAREIYSHLLYLPPYSESLQHLRAFRGSQSKQEERI